MDGELAKFVCRHCGFTDYVTDLQWNGSCGSGGLWAFKWWNGTDKGDKCFCPQCGKDVMPAQLQSGDFGMLVTMEEEWTD